MSDSNLPIWKVDFCPEEGRHSPERFLRDLAPDEQVAITNAIEKIRRLTIDQWPSAVHLEKVKVGKGVYLRKIWAGNFRIFFSATKGTIYIHHICRKASQKMKNEDRDRAYRNYQNCERAEP